MMTPTARLGGRRSGAEASGQALIEFAMVIFAMVIMAFGVIDFSRFIYTQQVVVNVTREGANLASRGTSITDAVTGMINSAAPLDINANGRVIITSVAADSQNVLRVTGQAFGGSMAANSRVGTGTGALAVVPATNPRIPQPTQTLYVSETFYPFTPITPIGRLLGLVLPTQIYDVAYF